MATSARGIALIKKWEGLYLQAYTDVAGIWTIGYGSISNDELGITVHPGQKITLKTAEEWMVREVRDKDLSINKLVKVPLRQYQYDALSAFVYNVGVEAFRKSTLLRLLNRGDYTSVSNQLLRWAYAYDKKTKTRRVIKGLLNRRRDEVLMWQGAAVSSLPPLAEEFTTTKPIPKINPDAASQVAKSRSAKAVLLNVGLLSGLMSDYPNAFPILLGVGLCSVYVLYRKYKDAQEIF